MLRTEILKERKVRKLNKSVFVISDLRCRGGELIFFFLLLLLVIINLVCGVRSCSATLS